MSLEFNGNVLPGVSSYTYSTALKFITVNSDGKRVLFAGCTSFNTKESTPTQPRYEINQNKTHPYENTKGMSSIITISVDGLKKAGSNILSEMTGVPDMVTIRQQNLPFEIEEYEVVQAKRADGSIDPSVSSQTLKSNGVYKNCVFTSLDRSVGTGDNLVVSYSATIEATHKE